MPCSGVNDVELSIELASTALHIATGFYYDKYGEPYTQQVGFKHAGYLRPGGALVMKVYEVRLCSDGKLPMNVTINHDHDVDCDHGEAHNKPFMGASVWGLLVTRTSALPAPLGAWMHG